MSEVPDKRVQGFRWQHISELSELINSLGSHGFRDWPESAEGLRTELETLRLDPEADIALLRSGDRLCGYVLTLPEPDIDRVVATVAVTSACQDEADQLVDFLMSQVRSVNASRAHVAARGNSAEPLAELETRGFSRITANLELVLPREQASRLADTELPAGFTVRPMRSFTETLLLTSVQNRVFADHWGFSKNTVDEVQARLELPATGPEHVLFIESPEGEIAGYIWTALEWQRDHTCGKVWMTGVAPDYRGKRLGTPLILAGIKHLLAEGAADVHLEVIEGNKAAMRIYSQLGFEKRSKTDWYEKRL